MFIQDMYMAVGRGKGVDIIHSYGDQVLYCVLSISFFNIGLGRWLINLFRLSCNINTSKMPISNSPGNDFD